VPATFLESAAGGAFELFHRRQFAGAGHLVQAALPDPLAAAFPAGQARAERPFRATIPLPALSIPAAPRLRRHA
jgi:hypothetical protein